mgnify:CR=1 FL=1
MAAHPRVCGENGRRDVLIHADPGSSPRVRGKPPAVPGRRRERGLIPACAGKTSSPTSRRCAPTAHPRVCGENWSTASRRSTASGSSPRVRGKRDHHRAHRRPRRLIPACAGKTAACHWSAPSERGSSPRVRGKLAALLVCHVELGLIPACAGKTRFRAWRGSGASAHPRVCGENASEPSLMVVVLGSSPRVRGKPVQHLHGGAWHGLIPACAGKTSRRRSLLRPSPAHPRVCGENLGSAPRASAPAWLIPACAGKTSYGCRPAACLSAHPRVCGENYWVPASRMRKLGSSPRVRGKLGVGEAHGGVDGLIPACAGKT